MNRIPILCIALLMTTVITLQMTALQKHIIYLPADDGQMKTRPAGFPDPAPMVVSLEEADRRFRDRFNETYEPVLPDRDETRCLLNDCEFEFYFIMAKYKATEFLSGLFKV